MVKNAMVYGFVLLAAAVTFLTGGTRASDIHPSKRAKLLPEPVLNSRQRDLDSIPRPVGIESLHHPTKFYDKTPLVVAETTAREQAKMGLPAVLKNRYRLVHEQESYYLYSGKDRILSIPSAWLVPEQQVKEEAGAYVSSFNFDEPVTAFPIGDGRLGLHLSSYEIQKEGSAQAAAGRDLFLVFDPQAESVHPGGLLYGKTKKRVRYMGQFFALAHRFRIGDINGDGLTDIGIIREEIRPAAKQWSLEQDVPYSMEYKKHRIRWFVYSRGPRTTRGSRNHWKYDPTLDWKIPKTGKVTTLPLIGIVKTPVEFVNELSGGKLKRSRTSSARFGPGIQQTMILRYDAFGPQAFAHELLGMEWYQWNTSGSSNPRQIDPIKVVVYRDINLEEVKQLYPVAKELEQDYRYVLDREALKYLERKIADFSDVKEDPEHKYYESLVSNLSKTRQRVIETLIFPRYKK